MLPKKTGDRAYLFMFFIFYIAFLFFGLHYTLLMNAAEAGGEMGGLLSNSATDPISLIGITWEHIKTSPFGLQGLSLVNAAKTSLIITFVFFIVVALNVTSRNMHRQDAPGKEKGSAEWFKNFKWYRERFTDPYSKYEQEQEIADNNALLAEGLKLSMDARYTNRNLNTVAVGGSGTGKTYGFIKPNLAQMNCSYVCTDPSGEIMQVMGIPLLEAGYVVKLFSTSDMKHSNCYNPMDYIYNESGDVDATKVAVLVSTFIKNAGDLQKKGGGDPFWEKSSTAWMTFAVFYLAEFESIEKRNMYNILKLAQAGKADENSSSSETILDRIVKDARNKNPDAKCFSSYDTFKLAPAKTANSILISIAVDLNVFSSDDVRNMTTTSYVCERNKNGVITKYIKDRAGNPIRDSKNLDLQTLGNVKTALFVNIPQANSAHNFLVSMMYSQLFDVLYSVAEKSAPNSYIIYDGRGEVLASGFKTEAAAKRHMEIYQNASVRADTINGVNRYFVYSDEKDAVILPEFLGKRGKRYIQEVHSMEVGEHLLQRYQKIPTLVYKSQKKVEEKKKLEKEKFEKETAGMSDEERRKYIEQKNDEQAEYLRNHPEDRNKQVKKGASLFNKPKVVKKPAYIKKGALRLPVHVRFLLDEFSNIGEIPNFDKMLSTMRKYEISCTIILQSLNQIKAKYDKIWETLVGNCDSVVFLGSSEMDTVKYMSEKLGKTTIRTFDTSQSKSAKSSSLSESYKKDARDLLDPAEIAKLDNEYCIVVVRGLSPFYLRKLRFNRHPNYYKTGDANDNKKIGIDFLENHFKCESKLSDDKASAEREERAEKDKYFEGTNKHDKVRKKEPVQDKKSMEKSMELKEDRLDAEMKQVSSVDPQDYHDSSSIAAPTEDPGMFIPPVSEFEMPEEVQEPIAVQEEKKETKRSKKTKTPKEDTSSKPNDTGNTKQGMDLTATNGAFPKNGPESMSDDSWIFF